MVHHKSSLINFTFHFQFEQIACVLGDNLHNNHVALTTDTIFTEFIFTVFDDLPYQMSTN